MAPGLPTVVNSSTVPGIQNAKSNEEIYNPYICLPYKGFQGEEIVKKCRDVLTKALPTNVKPRIIFKGKQLGSCFRIKDKVPLEHETNLVYAFKPTYNSEQKKLNTSERQMYDTERGHMNIAIRIRSPRFTSIKKVKNWTFPKMILKSLIKVTLKRLIEN